MDKKLLTKNILAQNSSDFDVEEYWEALPKFIEPLMFKFYNPNKCVPEDLYQRPGNNILALSNEILELMVSHVQPKITERLDNFKIVVVSKHARPSNRELFDDRRNSINYESLDAMMEGLQLLYKQRRTYLQTFKMGFTNAKLHNLFGDKPTECSIICGNIDLDKTMINSNIVERIEKVNNLHNILRVMNISTSIVQEEFSLLEKVQLMEISEGKILAKGLSISESSIHV